MTGLSMVLLGAVPFGASPFGTAPFATAPFATAPFATAPIDPDAEQAREWLLRELAKPEYEAARPTWFDRLAGAIMDWFGSLELGGASGPAALGILVVVIVVVVGLVVAFAVFGVPRLRQRSGLDGALFSAPDVRGAAALREAALAFAANGDWANATEEMFRAIARGLAERVIVSTSPGTTARDFAARAGAEFPDLSAALVDAAKSFDEVRYLGRPGSSASFDAVADLEATLRAARPQAHTPLASGRVSV